MMSIPMLRILAGSMLVGVAGPSAITGMLLGEITGPPRIYVREDARKKYVRPVVLPYPADNSPNEARQTLGRALFFDPRLSAPNSISCATCHMPSLSWGDGRAKAIGVGKKPLPRRTPTLLNLAEAELLFWDGRSESLEEQALWPIKTSGEMNLPLATMLERVRAVEHYQNLFEIAYPGEGLTEKTVSKAIANFERTIVSSAGPIDRWLGGDEQAISAEAKSGFDLFNGKARCAECHSGWAFTDHGFHDVGVADKDIGRGKFLKLEAMSHAFKTPTLRNIARRGPYMHNGSERTLADVVDFYDRGGKAMRNSLAPEVQRLRLSRAEKNTLVEFMKTLTSDDAPLPATPLTRSTALTWRVIQ